MADQTEVVAKLKHPVRDALELALMQYLNWGICTISWRAVAQANIMASIMTDTTLASLQFFVFRKLVKTGNEQYFIPWIGYTVGGVLGTITGIYLSIYLLGK